MSTQDYISFTDPPWYNATTTEGRVEVSTSASLVQENNQLSDGFPVSFHIRLDRYNNTQQKLLNGEDCDSFGYPWFKCDPYFTVKYTLNEASYVQLIKEVDHVTASHDSRNTNFLFGLHFTVTAPRLVSQRQSIITLT